MEQVKERTMTLACGALCALVFVSALFTPGQARGAAFAEPADATELPVLMVDPTPTLTASPGPHRLALSRLDRGRC